MIVGYTRVSTDGQTLDAQQAALREAGATSVFCEKVSGAKTDRAALVKVIAVLAVSAIADAGPTFKSLGDPWCDTTSAHGKH